MDKKYDVVGVGYCSLDHFCLVPEIPIDDKVQISELLVHGGGPAVTAIVAAARLGAKTAFIGAVGDDENGKRILDELQKEGIDISGVAIRPGASSPVAYCWAEAKSGRRSIAWSKGSAEPLRPDELNFELVRSSRILHLDGHQTEAANHAARCARECGTTVMLDAGSFRPFIADLMKLSNVVVASEAFANGLSKSKDPELALRLIREQGPEWAVVTLGKGGSVGFDGKEFAKQDSFKVDVVDTTGAGDVYHGAFAYRYLSNCSLTDVMRFSSAVAAMKCRKLGGRNGIPNLKEVELFIRQG